MEGEIRGSHSSFSQQLAFFRMTPTSPWVPIRVNPEFYVKIFIYPNQLYLTYSFLLCISKEAPILEYFCQFIEATIVEVENLVLALTTSYHNLTLGVLSVTIEYSE